MPNTSRNAMCLAKLAAAGRVVFRLAGNRCRSQFLPPFRERTVWDEFVSRSGEVAAHTTLLAALWQSVHRWDAMKVPIASQSDRSKQEFFVA